MSSRALRRLREEKEAAASLATTNEGDEDESSSEEEEVTTGGGGGGFMMMLDDESESESESESDDDEKKETTINTITNTTPNNESKKATPKKRAAEKKEEEDLDAILSDMNIIQQGTTTDTDHHAIDSAAVGNSNSACIQKHLKPNTIRQLLLSSSTTNNKNEGGYHYDIQDLDLDYAMRSLVGGGANIAGDPFAMDDLHAQQQQQRGRRGGHRTGGRGGRMKRLVKKYLFGKPRAEWGKPPSYVGGGLGMKELTADVLEEERHSWSIPWPYNNLYTDDNEEVEEEGENESSDIDDDKIDDVDKDHNNKHGKNNKQQFPTHPSTTLSNNQKWYTLQMSDTYQETNYQYQEMLSTTGGGGGGEQGMHDPNALAMFVADHPYFAETLLQLAMVLYYINDRGKGNDLLRRCMFIYESALPMNVLPSSSATSSSGNNDNDNGNTTTDNNNNNCEILIDIDRPPNSGLFATIFRIMQTSGMSGCYASALATGRYLLSLDPLRDPMGVLLILDYYALATRRISSMSFIVTLVHSNFIAIHYKDPLTSRHHKCNLIDMPNWAFSYALALYRLAQQQQNENEDEDSGDESSSPSEQYQERAEEALVHALRTFPMVLPKLLAMNNVNVEDRGMIMDWPSILPLYIADANGTNSIATNDTVEDRVTRASGEHLVRIFVQRCHKLWKEDDLVKWMFHCAQRVIMEHQEQEQEGKSSTPSTTTDTPSTPMTSTFSPALARYAQCDPSEYEDSFRTFPPEAIALDPNIVAPAMALGPNGRRRFLRQRGQQQQQQQLLREAGQGQDPLEIIRRLLGLGNDDGGLGDVEVLDPDSPLLQLYLQSLLPWAQVEGVRPPPR